jgi:hypothetical protein
MASKHSEVDSTPVLDDEGHKYESQLALDRHSQCFRRSQNRRKARSRPSFLRLERGPSFHYSGFTDSLRPSPTTVSDSADGKPTPHLDNLRAFDS